jgi:hypothetical protein
MKAIRVKKARWMQDSRRHRFGETVKTRGRYHSTGLRAFAQYAAA